MSTTRHTQTPAADFFEELSLALRLRPDYARVYNRYYRVFRTCLDENTRDSGLHLNGTFALTDYLLKERQAPRNLVREVNDTRVRLRQRSEKTDGELERWHLVDLRNLCRLIAFLYPDDIIPDLLAALFPQDEEDRNQRSQVLGERLRMIVDRWDDDCVYGEADSPLDGETVKVCYAHGNTYYDQDWTYLRALVHKGAQLNIIRPRERDGVIYPELIIFDPDNLIGISTIARCFTSYAESPLVGLLERLSPSANSQAILLGNFAGQLLDEQIHPQPEGHTYKDSARTFWQQNAIDLLTADLDKSFHTDAQRQLANIARAVTQVLPGGVRRFKWDTGMTEPSFISEMLGLQGRMDFLQLDFRILMEQKSGKGAFPYDGFVVPRQREEHYVQMLLYMLLVRYNFRETYERNQHELHAFLLYSKYEESLLGLGFAPELVFRAIKVRNQLAWMEQRLARPDGFRILERLTPEQLNEKGAKGTLWENYQRPQIAALLDPIRAASPLERAYYFRFLTFIAAEHLLSKLGNRRKEGSGFAATWNDSLEEKLQAGNIYHQLTMLDPKPSAEGSITRLTLRFSEDGLGNLSNFRVGDIVMLYSYADGQEPDACLTILFRSTIAVIDTETIELELRAPQSSARVFQREEGTRWAIEHDFMEAAFGSQYRAMHAFLSAPRERRDLLLLQRRPATDASRQLRGDYGAFNDLALRVRRASDLFLIIGPPGTGKTSFGMLTTLKEELAEEDGAVLLLSYTNRAVDEICSKLVADDIDFIRIGKELSCAPEYRSHLLSAVSRECPDAASLKRRLTATRVYAATTASMNGSLNLFQLRQFSLAIVDEASQILEPQLIGLLSATAGGQSAIRKVVMIGDHKQLPAVVQQRPEESRVSEPILRDILLTDCRLSLFERLLRRYRDDADVVYMLHRQGRMHHHIALFPNEAFYNGLLDEVPRPHQRQPLARKGNSTDGIENLLQTRRVAFIHTDGPELPLSEKVNPIEADLIAALVVHIYRREQAAFLSDTTVGVIVPYRNQIAAVRDTIARSGIDALQDITIDTVERFQGSQRRYIIYGLTVQQPYQLDFLTENTFEDTDGTVVDRKLNVAMTRAEEHLLFVGNATLLARDPVYRRLIEFLRTHNDYFDIPPDRFVNGEFQV